MSDIPALRPQEIEAELHALGVCKHLACSPISTTLRIVPHRRQLYGSDEGQPAQPPRGTSTTRHDL